MIRSLKETRLYLLGSSLDGAVLAGHVLAVPVVGGAAGQAEVGVTLPHCQVAGTLLGVTLGFAPTTWETVLACIHTAAHEGITSERALFCRSC